MYKKQLGLQKILCLAAIIMGAAVFVYSLGIITDLYDTLYSTMRNPKDLYDTKVSGSIVYYEMQAFNQSFMLYGIGMILSGALLFLTNTHIRRRYYIGNYFATGLYAVAAIGGAVWAHLQIEVYKAKFLAVDFQALKTHAETFKSTYTESTFWFDIHYAVFALLIAVALLLVLNALWKRSLMRQEAALLRAGEE